MELAHKIIEGIHYATGRVVRIGTANGLIHSITDVDENYHHDLNGKSALPMVAPALVDLQVNGFRGVDFNNPGLCPEEIVEACGMVEEQCVRSFYPTLITGSPDATSLKLKTLTRVIDEGGELSHALGGIHLEGPFISPEDGPRGAHAKEHCRIPDSELVKRWQDEARGNIRIITLAPELPGSGDLIGTCLELGMIVAIGHTAADGEDIKRAVDAGASLSTHLGNGAHAVLPRHPNYIWDQLAEDRLWASMMADGFHLDDSVLKVFARVKGEKGILVSDSMCYAGMEPGNYESPVTGKVCLTKEGKIHLEGQPGVLAGSATSLLGGVKEMARLIGFSAAWDMASINPGRLMHPDLPGGLKVGAPDRLVLLDSRQVPGARCQ